MTVKFKCAQIVESENGKQVNFQIAPGPSDAFKGTPGGQLVLGQLTDEAAARPVTCTVPERPASMAYVPVPLPEPSTVRTRLAPTIEKFSAHVPVTVFDGALGLEQAEITINTHNTQSQRRISPVCHGRTTHHVKTS